MHFFYIQEDSIEKISIWFPRTNGINLGTRTLISLGGAFRTSAASFSDVRDIRGFHVNKGLWLAEAKHVHVFADVIYFEDALNGVITEAL